MNGLSLIGDEVRDLHQNIHTAVFSVKESGYPFTFWGRLLTALWPGYLNETYGDATADKDRHPRALKRCSFIPASIFLPYLH